MKNKTFSLALAAASLLGGCAAHNPAVYETAKFQKPSPAALKLNQIPSAGAKVAVAVYGFTDQTGQFKPTDGAQTLSRAVTQGATSILVEVLHEVGNRGWFKVIERERLDNVLRERAVIREMRSSYLGEKSINPQALPPLLFAGMLLEGGIIGYDANTKSGGAGARFLGIGANAQYREDTVTIYLRAVSVKTGEVLTSVSVRKSIASVKAGADAFRYVAFKELLELESGVSYNEPDQLALRQAIEEAVYGLIMEGTMQNMWCFNADGAASDNAIRTYLAYRFGVSEDKVQMPILTDGNKFSASCGVQAAMAQAQKPQFVSTMPPPRAASTKQPQPASAEGG